MTAIIKKLLTLAMAFTLALSLVGCGVDVTGVSLNLPDTIEKGTTLVATPEYAFDGATPETAELEKKLDKLEMRYTSSDPSILVVDDNGNLVAVSAGTAEVALSSKDGTVSTSKTLEVVVSPTEMKTTDELTLTAGEVATLETAVTPTDATHVSISYASSDDSIATVNNGGEVKAVAAGDATVTAVVDGTSLTSSCKITVLPALESIELSNTTLSLQPNDTAQLSYTAQPENALIKEATYTSSDDTVATVDANGNVTAIADGKATITASVGDVSAECVVTVDSTVSSSKTSAKGNSSSGSASSGTNSGLNDTSSSASAPAASSSFEYGALPMDSATDGETWWSIDSSDSAYWAVANNINAMRTEGGLSALTVSSSLSSIADSRCEYLIANDVFSHDGATTAEILCSGATSASAACTGWKNSPSHYSNIMTPGYTQMGIGCIFNTAYGVEVWCVTFS